MVESGGNPNAISPVGATGLWQFMPYTGKQYGLTQNTWIDERRDPYKATYAASDYLLKLYNDFSNWHLAVAAYNAGEGKIGRAVSGTGAKDFFELCRLDCELDEKARLKNETRDYVPRLIAMAKIMRNLKRLGFQEPSPEAAYHLAPLNIPAGTNLSGLARTLDLTWDEFSGMNPAFRRTASPPTDSSTGYVPPSKMAVAVQWVASSDARTYAGWKEYTIKKGDSLASIAKRNKVSLAALQEANGLTKMPARGATILIPGKGEVSVEPVYAALPEAQSAPTASAGRYTVQAGDSLTSLAKAWGTDVKSIRLANRMGPRDNSVKPGQRLSIPGNSTSVPAPVKQSDKGSRNKPENRDLTPPRSAYTVRSGDTVFSIARTCGVSVQALCSANGLDSKKPSIRTGQTLTVPGKGGAGKPEQSAAPQGKPSAANTGKPSAAKPAASAAPASQEKPLKPAGKGRSVTVKAGESLFGIARANGVSVQDLQKANGLGNSTNVRVGQKLTLP